MPNIDVSLIVLIFLLAFIVYKEQLFQRQFHRLEDRAFAERQELLDRLMSGDFFQFKQAQLVEKAGVQQPQDNYPQDSFELLDQ